SESSSGVSGGRTSAGAAPPANRQSHLKRRSGKILIREDLPNVRSCIRTTFDLDIGVDEEVQRRPRLRRLQHQVAADAESDAVLRQVAEVILDQLRIGGAGLIRRRDIDGNPRLAVRGELRPAMVAPDLALA